MCLPPNVADIEPGSSTTDEDEEPDDPSRNMIIRAKWTMDSAKTLDECIERLHAYIQYLGELKEQGWELIGAVDDDYGFLRKHESS